MKTTNLNNGQIGLVKELYIKSRGNRKYSVMIKETINGKVTKDDFVYTGSKKRCNQELEGLNHSILGS